MRITRYYSERRRSPYSAVGFRACERPSGNRDRIELPSHWTDGACDVFETRCLVSDGIPSRLVAVAEDDVPRWLWRHEPDQASLADLPPHRRERGETSARNVFDRIAGALTYQGWKGGYFDAEADARAFYDEMRALLCRQIAGPEIGAWRHAGLWWAYGMATPCVGCVVDAATGGAVAAGPAHLPPHGAFIHGVSADVAAEGGVIDLWRREAALLAAGFGSGANLSEVGAGGAGTLVDHLRLGDGSAAMFRDPDHLGSPARTVVIDAEHPDALAFVAWKAAENQKAIAQLTGSAIVERHVAAIVAACRREGLRPCFDPARNPALRLAVASARQAMVSDALIQRTIALVRQGRAVAAEDAIEPLTEYGAFAAVPGQNGCHLLRAGDAALEDDDASPLDSVAASAWSAGPTGLLFRTAAETWNTCASSGEITAVAGDGDFMFLDDTACGRAMLNLAGFLGTNGFDAVGFAHAARLMTIALDIAIAMSAVPTPRLARRRWDFRPIGVGLTNLGGALLAQGIAYDSDAGRSFCAAACALMTGSAYAASAEMAAEMGAFPAFERNRSHMLRVVADHRLAATGGDVGHVGTASRPVPLRADDCPQSALVESARAAWERAIVLGTRAGFRNAQVSSISPAEAESALFDCAAAGIAPASALVRYERLAGAGFHKTILPTVTRGLRAFGYGETAIDAIARHVAGHRTLADAPGVNHEHLRRRGFTEAALQMVEAALADAPDIRFAFDRWTLGDRFCIDMLGFPTEALDNPSFDMLTALGFSDAAIEAANIHCCGAETLEGAPYIEPEHLAAFDCPQPLGDRGRRRLSVESRIRMMAVAQPFVSGGIGQTLTVPADATVQAMREWLLLAWRLGLKSIAMERDSAVFGDAYADVLPTTGIRPTGTGNRFTVILGSRHRSSPAAGAGARAMRGFDAAEPAAHGTRDTHRTDSGGSATASAPADAETSRRRSSHVARSATSVPSSADVAVEQRQV